MNQRARREAQGRRGEAWAAWYLRLKGWRVVARRLKTPRGEIDLIARRGRVLAFIEVKARRNKDSAAEAIHPRNQQRVMRAAQIFLQQHPDYANATIRFDACLVPWYGWPHYIPEAFC